MVVWSSVIIRKNLQVNLISLSKVAIKLNIFLSLSIYLDIPILAINIQKNNQFIFYY